MMHWLLAVPVIMLGLAVAYSLAGLAISRVILRGDQTDSRLIFIIAWPSLLKKSRRDKVLC
jgi:hypothetical protein